MLSPEDLVSKIESAGGGVRFVFGEERPFAQCHASTIVQAANGDLLCAWFGGTKESADDVAIWLARYADGAWEKPERAAKVNETAHWNPVLFRDADDALYLFFKVGPDIDFWQTYWKKSDDNGETWTEPVELVPGDEGGRGPVRSKPIILSDGTWLAGASTEHRRWEPFADRSADKGATWERSENFAVDRKTLGSRDAIQPTVWESKSGHVHALLRTKSGKVWRVDSEDGGKTWSDVRATELPNPNSGIDVEKLGDGRLLLVYNPTGRNWGPRTPLDVAVSDDNGESWTTWARLEDDANLRAEYSYPAIARTNDGVAISYTWNRDRVRVWRIPMAVIE